MYSNNSCTVNSSTFCCTTRRYETETLHLESKNFSTLYCTVFPEQKHLQHLSLKGSKLMNLSLQPIFRIFLFRRTSRKYMYICNLKYFVKNVHSHTHHSSKQVFTQKFSSSHHNFPTSVKIFECVTHLSHALCCAELKNCQTVYCACNSATLHLQWGSSSSSQQETPTQSQHNTALFFSPPSFFFDGRSAVCLLARMHNFDEHKHEKLNDNLTRYF